MERIRVIDTHTGGEPTRVVVSSPVALVGSTMAERRDHFRTAYDHFRRAIVCEPRGNDVMVGALLTDPVSTESIAGVVFFNNVGVLGMCGHGLMGVAVALQFLECIEVGSHQIDTPVGTVQFTLSADGCIRLQNVPSYRVAADVPIQLASGQVIHGDVAWGGNWFYICHDHGATIALSNLRQLDALSREIRAQLEDRQLTGDDGERIDHIELVGPPTSPQRADAKNFVLCPGGAYDRSPCGTGTSATVACLAARGELAENVVYRQESIVGSIFRATYRRLSPQRVEPTLEGRAFINGEGELLLDPHDPFCMGIGS